MENYKVLVVLLFMFFISTFVYYYFEEYTAKSGLIFGTTDPINHMGFLMNVEDEAHHANWNYYYGYHLTVHYFAKLMHMPLWSATNMFLAFTSLLFVPLGVLAISDQFEFKDFTLPVTMYVFGTSVAVHSLFVGFWSQAWFTVFYLLEVAILFYYNKTENKQVLSFIWPLQFFITSAHLAGAYFNLVTLALFTILNRKAAKITVPALIISFVLITVLFSSPFHYFGGYLHQAVTGEYEYMEQPNTHLRGIVDPEPTFPAIHSELIPTITFSLPLTFFFLYELKHQIRSPEMNRKNLLMLLALIALPLIFIAAEPNNRATMIAIPFGCILAAKGYERIMDKFDPLKRVALRMTVWPAMFLILYISINSYILHYSDYAIVILDPVI